MGRAETSAGDIDNIPGEDHNPVWNFPRLVLLAIAGFILFVWMRRRYGVNEKKSAKARKKETEEREFDNGTTETESEKRDIGNLKKEIEIETK